MPRLIFKCPYIKGGTSSATAHLENYVKYMATRNGVERIDPGRSEWPATSKQKKMVEQILRDFPLSRGMFEYEDYAAEPTRTNASEFITRALEDNYTLMLMTPYYPVNRKVDLPEAFDALFYPPDLETVPKRLAIVRANRYMVERSDFLIAYVRHPASNARELLEYAGTGKRKGKIHITNLAEEQISLPKKTDDVI